MQGLVITPLAALMWAYIVYEGLPMFRTPQFFKAEEWVLMKRWAVAASVPTIVGIWFLLTEFLCHPKP